MGIATVIVGATCTFDQADVETHHFATDGIDLVFSDLDILFAHDVVAQLLQLHRKDARHKLFGEHLHLGIIALFDPLVEIGQLVADHFVERLVVLKQIEIKDLVGNFRCIVHSGTQYILNVADTLLRDIQAAKFRTVTQVPHKLVDPDVEVEL